MVLIPFADFRPDSLATLYNMEAHPEGFEANNSFPMSDSTDAPLRTRSAQSNAAALTILGLHAADQDNWFSGAATKLYKHNAGTNNWDDVAGAAYTATTTNPWAFCVFGDRVIATDYTDAVQVYQMGVSALFANLSAGAPKARHIATVEPGFVMLGGINDGTAKPRTVRWSGINDATSWPTIGTAAAAAAQSDLQELPLGGDVMAILPGIGGASAAIFTERAIYMARYIGPPAIFEIKPVVTHIGCAAPRSAIAIGGVAYFYSHDGFFAFDGSQLKPIGEGRVNRFFSETAAANKYLPFDVTSKKFFGGHDSYKKTLAWAFPASGTLTAADRWLVYNYVSDRWRYTDNATATVQWLGTVKFPKYEAIAGFGTDKILYIWDDVAQSSVSATFETADFDAGPGTGRRVAVKGVRLLSDSVAADTLANVGTREDMSAAITYGTTSAPNAVGVCPQRNAGRYVRVRARIANSATGWTWAKGVDVDLEKLGKR